MLIFKLALLTFPHLSFASQQDRILSTADNIGQIIREQHSNGNKQARFAIHADVEGLATEIEFDVVEAVNPALTPNTIVKIDGNESPIGNDVLYTLLVSDIATASGAETFALLAVNPANDEVHGIVDPKGKTPYRISQGKGKAKAVEETNLVAPAWTCGVDGHGGVFDRRLEHEHDELEHEHHDHEHHHDHESLDSAIESLSKQLRGAKVNPLNKPRRLQFTSYNYQVDIYLQIDNAFVSKTGGTLNTAMNYINSLVTAANVIYHREIETHLNVAVVELTTLYDTATSTSNALNTMVNRYGANTWHTPGIDLQHALLGKALGGGIAYLGVLCNSNYGYGLSANIDGNFLSLDYTLVWDLMVFMHEVGHNFNSGHTHDGYSPAIDTCGTSCPADSSNTKWSTIMSYCHLCSDGYANQMYTFGGLYTGSGTKSNIANWIDNPNLVANYNAVRYSVDPRRASNKMYAYASTRGSCLAVPVSTPSPTKSPVGPTTPPPTKTPVTQAPTVTVNCADPSLTQAQCVAAPNCEWVKVKGSSYCRFISNPPPSPPSGTCDPTGTACNPNGPNNCCFSCYSTGKWANTCK